MFKVFHTVQQWKYLLIPIISIYLLCSCDQSKLQGESPQASSNDNDFSAIENEQKADKRPQETGEGLPGYLHCTASDYDPSADLYCRYEKGGLKQNLSDKAARWTISFASSELVIEGQELSPTSDWHVVFNQEALSAIPDDQRPSSILSLRLGTETIQSELAQTGAIFDPNQAGFAMIMGPDASGRQNSWLGLDLNAPTSSELTTSMSSPIGLVNFSINPAQDVSLTPESGLSNQSSLDFLTQSAIGTNGDSLISISLPQGSYKFAIALSLDPEAELTIIGKETLTFKNSDHLIYYRGEFVGERLTLSLKQVGKVYLHSLTINR